METEPRIRLTQKTLIEPQKYKCKFSLLITRDRSGKRKRRPGLEKVQYVSRPNTSMPLGSRRRQVCLWNVVEAPVWSYCVA